MQNMEIIIFIYRYADTLTGFKWIGNKCYDLTQQGKTVLLAYEVEIGFLVGTISYDKDGVRTSAVFNELAAHWHRQSKTCFQRLQELYQKYGYFVGLQSYFIVENRSDADAIFYTLRNYPDHNSNHKYPSSCGNYKITSVRDVTLGKDTGTSDGRSDMPTDPTSQMLTFRFENGSVVTLRNSGTEPKLKLYVECVDERSEEHARALLTKMTDCVIENFIQPAKYNLIAKS
jgi:phosphomannomutase